MSEQKITEQEYQKLFNALIKKENNLLLFKKDNKEIFILGTMHHFHLAEDNNYSLAHVQSVIKTIAPDLLLIEARPETLEKYNAVDGPFEMIFARCYADEQGIPVKGVDWWKIVESNEAMKALNLERDDRMFNNILSSIGSYDKVLVIMGASHRERMPERFLKNGFTQTEIVDILSYFSRVDSQFRYPQRMIEEYTHSHNYYQTGFLEEVNQSITPNNELYEMFINMAKNRLKMVEMINENKQYIS